MLPDLQLRQSATITPRHNDLVLGRTTFGNEEIVNTLRIDLKVAHFDFELEVGLRCQAANGGGGDADP